MAYNRQMFAVQLIRITSLILVSQLFITMQLWIPFEREFPLIPLLSSLPLSLGLTLSIGLFAACIGSLLFLIIKPFSRVASSIILSAFVLLILEDVSRLQPWLYLDCLLFLTILLHKKEEDLHYLLPLVALFSLSATYLWSGIQKCNVAFATEFFPWLLDFIVSEEFFQEHTWIAGMVPLAEISAGIGLLVKRVQKHACFLAIGVHGFILLSLGPLVHHWNMVVWPWSVQWIGFLVLLIRHPVEIHWKIPQLSHQWMVTTYLFLLYIAPILNYAGLWDHHLSGSLYSGNSPEAIFYYHPSDRDHLPKSTKDYQYSSELFGEFILIDHWAMGELEAPFYPQERYFREVGKALSKNIKQLGYSGIVVTIKSKWTSEQHLLRIPTDSL